MLFNSWSTILSTFCSMWRGWPASSRCDSEGLVRWSFSGKTTSVCQWRKMSLKYIALQKIPLCYLHEGSWCSSGVLKGTCEKRVFGQQLEAMVLSLSLRHGPAPGPRQGCCPGVQVAVTGCKACMTGTCTPPGGTTLRNTKTISYAYLENC